MLYQAVFAQFWELVVESINNRSFAKLTLAKTIGDTDLKNVYVRPMLHEDGSMNLSVIEKYKMEEIENFYSLEESYFILLSQINNPFLSALLFTVDNDIVFKLNKKRAATILEQEPTFKKASDVMLEMKEKGL